MSRFQGFVFLKKLVRDISKCQMSTNKYDQILLYCHFNKIKKGPGTSFQSPAVNQKHVRNVCHTAH